MTAIQAIYIRSYEQRPTPKPHVVYRIEIQAHVRSWQMWHRYSEFVELHTELSKSTGSSPPAPLPPKNAFSVLKGPFQNEAAFIEQRRAALETYLRAILSAKEDRWRDSYAFRDFLGVPVGKQASALEHGSTKFSSASWLDEHLELQSRIRDVRADVNRRDTLSDRGDVNASHTTNVQAKKRLAEILSRVRILTEGLQELGMSGMAEGELQRRTDMVARLQDDCEKLGKMLTVTRRATRMGVATPSPTSGFTNVAIAPESDRAALLGGSKPVTRVFGVASKKPQETDVTRPLDDHGLHQLQKTQLEYQDTQLSQLTSILQRQRHLGEAINAELVTQNEMLDNLNNEVDQVGVKLSSAKKQLNRLG
ncbi:Phox homologous domain-containing protein [Chiua virens]|nr:Phox homologous domain-containing protein [Chiua virens]